jgi:predicted NodU family carbamoyl transferase
MQNVIVNARMMRTYTRVYWQSFADYELDTVAYYERPWLKQLRRLRSGEGIDWTQIPLHQVIKQQLGAWLQPQPVVRSYPHHLSHAAAGFQTSPFERATVVVIDAIGEFDTATIYGAEYDPQVVLCTGAYGCNATHAA